MRLSIIALILLFTTLTQSSIAQAELTNDIIFVAYQKIKAEPLKAKVLEPFLQRYYKNEYEKNTADKVSKKSYMTEKTMFYTQAISSMNLKAEYIIDDTITLKDYDIEKKAFELELGHYLSRGKINPVGKWAGNLDYVCKVSNIDSYEYLEMDYPNLIETFVNATPPAQKGKVRVTMSIRFYSAINDDIQQFGRSVMFAGNVMCKIEKMVFHFSETNTFEYRK